MGSVFPIAPWLLIELFWVLTKLANSVLLTVFNAPIWQLALSAIHLTLSATADVFPIAL